MKIILNYTGKRIGLTNVLGMPREVLPSHGKAYVEDKRYWGHTEIEQTVRGLPKPDRNLEKYYIVSKEVGEWFGDSRRDLLIAENPIAYEGAMFYNFSKIHD